MGLWGVQWCAYLFVNIMGIAAGGSDGTLWRAEGLVGQGAVFEPCSRCGCHPLGSGRWVVH